MNNDLIKRNIAIAYATSGLIRRIDGEEWIRISEVKQSLQDVPTVEEKPQGEWTIIDKDHISFRFKICSNCGKEAEWLDGGSQFLSKFCPNCGAKMGGGAE